MSARTLSGLFRAIRANLRSSQADRVSAMLHNGAGLEGALRAVEAGPVASAKLAAWCRWYDGRTE